MWACEEIRGSEGRQRVLLLFVYTLFVWCIWNLWPSTTTPWSHHLNANGGILSTSPKVNRGKKRKKEEEEIDRGLNYCDLEGKRLALTMRQTPSGLPLSTCIPTDRLTNPFFGRLYRIYVSISLDLDLAHGEGGRGRRRACIAWRDEVWKIINSLFYHDRFLPYTWLSGPSTLIHFLNLLR